MDGLGARIKAARKGAKLTYEELAKACDVRQTTITRWQNDKMEPTASNLRAIVLATGVSADELLGVATGKRGVGPAPAATVADIQEIKVLLQGLASAAARADTPRATAAQRKLRRATSSPGEDD